MADTPLDQKLGIKPALPAYVLHAPTAYEHELPMITLVGSIGELPKVAKWIQAFYAQQNDLGQEMVALKDRLAKDGQLWICWPKRSSGVGSDLNDTIVRTLGLKAGLVDTKVASINDIWSGLKFVYRLIDR